MNRKKQLGSCASMVCSQAAAPLRTTTDNDHGSPIYPTSQECSGRPNQLWVADLTYVAIVSGSLPRRHLMLVARVVGYALGRSIDARITVAALAAAIGTAARRGAFTFPIADSSTPLRCYRELLALHGLMG